MVAPGFLVVVSVNGEKKDVSLKSERVYAWMGAGGAVGERAVSVGNVTDVKVSALRLSDSVVIATFPPKKQSIVVSVQAVKPTRRSNSSLAPRSVFLAPEISIAATVCLR